MGKLKFILLTLSLMFLTTTLVNSQNNAVKFEYISIEQGLSQSTIYCVNQDNKGFLWIGTQDGLNRYDGYNFSIFKFDFVNKNSLSNNDIRVITHDANGWLWIGTWGGGLNLYNPSKKEFTRFKNDAKNTTSLSNNFVYSICVDKKADVWIGTLDGVLNQYDSKTSGFIKYPVDVSLKNNQIYAVFEDKLGNLWIGSDAGLSLFDRKTKRFSVSYKNDPNNEYSISSDQVTAIFEDHAGQLWVGTKKGLNIFDRNTKTFKHLYSNSKESNSLSNNNITCIYQTKSKKIWIGTEVGLNAYQPATNSFVQYLNHSDDPYSLNNNNVLSIFEDQFGILWVGTYGSGLNKYDSQNKQFVHYNVNANSANSLTNNMIFSICKDESDNVWTGTYGGGVNILSRESNTYSYLRHEAANTNSIGSDLIRFIHLDNEGIAWIATTGGGLNKYNPKTKKVTRYTHSADNANSISSNDLYFIYEDYINNLWIGTKGGGVCKFNKETEEFTVFKNIADNQNSLSNNDVFCIKEDADANLWFCTRNGLCKFDSNKRIWYRYFSNPDDPHSISHSRAYTIANDIEGNLWVGTANGLNKLNPHTNRFERFTEKEGLSNSVIYSILQDKNRNIWIGTNGGLSKFNPFTKTFKNYTQQDGLQSNEFNVNTCFRGDDNEILFGGINGFNTFYADSIKDNPFVPPIVISNFKIFNIPVEPGQESPLSVSITETKQLTLTQKDYSFAFEFAALHFSSPSKNRYAYKLENFDKNWNYTDEKMRFAVYTNLDPGNYVFTVKGSNCDDIWNETGTSIKIKILPPYWKTWWFRTLMFILVGGSIGSWYLMRMKNLQHQKNELERLVKERTAEIEKQKESIQHYNIELEQQKEEIRMQTEILAATNKELEKLSIVASETDNAILIMDNQGNFEWVNDAYTRMFGYTLEELIQNISKNIVGPNTSPEIRDKIAHCIEHKETVQYELLSKTRAGRQLWAQITVTPIINEHGEVSKLVAIDSDISKMKEAEAEIMLQKEEIQTQADNLEITNRELEKLSIVARETNNAVFIMDASGDIEWVNESFSRLFGYVLDEFVALFGKNIADFSSNSNVREAITKCISDKKPYIYESVVPCKNGDKVWVQTTLTPIIDELGHIKKLIAIDSDINKLKEAENEIRQQSEELMAQRDELEMQKNQIQEKNHLIRGSINYALSIQKAMLPLREVMDDYFETFIIYKPKDIVSGDFYWFSNVSLGDGVSEKIFLAVVDCTGHGVPGAFMSMIGIRLLSEIVNEKGIYNPAEILELLNNNVVKALKQEQNYNTDGMDICLCVFDNICSSKSSQSIQNQQQTKVTFAGAKRPLFYYKHDGTEIVTVKASRKSIGGAQIHKHEAAFESTEFLVEKDDILYLMTDGMIDQNRFDRKRFGTQKLLEVLTANIQQPLDKQKEIIEDALLLFQANEEQRDDITVIGLKIR